MNGPRSTRRSRRPQKRVEKVTHRITLFVRCRSSSKTLRILGQPHVGLSRSAARSRTDRVHVCRRPTRTPCGVVVAARTRERRVHCSIAGADTHATARLPPASRGSTSAAPLARTLPGWRAAPDRSDGSRARPHRRQPRRACRTRRRRRRRPRAVPGRRHRTRRRCRRYLATWLPPVRSRPKRLPERTTHVNHLSKTIPRPGICSVAGDSGTSVRRYDDFFMASGYASLPWSASPISEAKNPTPSATGPMYSTMKITS